MRVLESKFKSDFIKSEICDSESTCYKSDFVCEFDFVKSSPVNFHHKVGKQVKAKELQIEISLKNQELLEVIKRYPKPCSAIPFIRKK